MRVFSKFFFFLFQKTFYLTEIKINLLQQNYLLFLDHYAFVW